jgi:hypothetical protein
MPEAILAVSRDMIQGLMPGPVCWHGFCITIRLGNYDCHVPFNEQAAE